METGVHHIIAKYWDRSPESLTFLQDHSILVTAQEYGHLKLFEIDLETSTILERISQHSVKAVHFVPNLNQVIFLYESQLFPPEMFFADINTWTINQMTFFNEEILNSISFSQPQEFWFRGARHDLIHGWIIPPAEYEESKTYPLAFLIHGGPEGVNSFLYNETFYS